MKDVINEKITGHVLITDLVTGEVLLDKFNAINFDAYSKKAYPGATILYYQLDAVLSLLGSSMLADA